MPSTPFDPRRPTLYLDHAVLSYAFNASHGGENDRQRFAAIKPLTAFVEACSRDLNLCVSQTHVEELAAWPLVEAAAMAAWLETMPLVWARNVQHLVLDEAVCWIRGQRCGGLPLEPWACSLSGVFEDATDYAAIQPFMSVPSVFQQLRKMGNQKARGVTMSATERLFADHEWAKQQRWSKDRMRDHGARARADSVRATGRRAAIKLRLPEPAYSTVVVGLVRAYRLNAEATMPGQAVQHACVEAFAQKARTSELGNKHSSTLWDIAHATVGGAYADVFTCDSRTAPAVDSARLKLGRAAALVNAPTSAFLNALEKAASEAQAAADGKH